jgi:hypothetical protein
LKYSNEDAALALRNSNYNEESNLTIHDVAQKATYVFIGGGNHLIHDSEFYNTGLDTEAGVSPPLKEVKKIFRMF